MHFLVEKEQKSSHIYPFDLQTYPFCQNPNSNAINQKGFQTLIISPLKPPLFSGFRV